VKRATRVRLLALSALLPAAAWASTGGAGASSRFQRAVPTPNEFNTVPYRSFSGPGGTGILGVGKNVNITKRFGAQSETSIAVDPTDPNHMYAQSNDLGNFSTYNSLYESFDRGRTWASAGLTVNTFCYDPWVDFNTAGDIFVGYECSDQRIAYKLHGTNNWVQSGSLPAGSFPDRDMVVTDDTPTSPFFNSVYIGYDDNGSSNRAQLMYSRNGQSGWTKSAGIDDTPTTFDVIGVNAAVANNGDVYATWEDYAHGFIKNDVSHDGGATWGTDRIVHDFRINTSSFFISIPPQNSRGVLPMPMTEVAPAGTTYAGRLYVVYFDTDTDGSSNTEIYFRYSDDGGATWSAEKLINDDTVDAWHFFPSISVAPNGTIGVSFYDTRNDLNDKKTDQYASWSTDGGNTWAPNVRVTTAQSDETVNFDANQYGDYEGGDVSSTGFFQFVWTDSRPGSVAEDMATASAR
jgi:BNR repeat-like domain